MKKGILIMHMTETINWMHDLRNHWPLLEHLLYFKQPWIPWQCVNSYKDFVAHYLFLEPQQKGSQAVSVLDIVQV